MSDRIVHMITGLSGSGKSTAARALEDAGFFVIDNLPLALLPQCLLLTQGENHPVGPVAVVLDIRNRGFLDDVTAIFDEVEAAGFTLKILFFDASDESLARRYSETRRRHPLVEAGDKIEVGVHKERALLASLCKRADVVFDSSGLTPQQLREHVLHATAGLARQRRLSVQLESFGFRYGLPRNADLVFDVRFMPNPYYVDGLRELNGLDPAVQEYVWGHETCQTFLHQLNDMLHLLLPQYRKEGKNYLTVAIGCTGGRHRSVSIVESLRTTLNDEGIELHVAHRDVDKG